MIQQSADTQKLTLQIPEQSGAQAKKLSPSSKIKTPPLKETIKRISFPGLPLGYMKIDPTYSKVPEDALYNEKYNYHYVPSKTPALFTTGDFDLKSYDKLVQYEDS